MRLGIYCISLFLALQQFASFGQQVRIIDRYTRKPVSDVFIFEKNHKHAVISDKEGKADLSLFRDADSIVFQHPAYQRYVTDKMHLRNVHYRIYISKNVIQMPVFVFSHARATEYKQEIPQKITIIPLRDFDLSASQNTADLLQNRGEVSVQKSQLGGGSPVLRGFEANKVLLVVDGVRMNNAIYRSGHLQNVIAIDQNALEKVELLYGPGSVAYGSDALGGVIHFYTRDPVLGKGDSTVISAGILTKIATADKSVVSGIHMNIGLKKIGFYTHVTASHFNDLRMGHVRNHGYEDFGKILHYADRIDNKDSMLINPDYNVHINSGYEQMDGMQKILYKPSGHLAFTLNMQYSKSSDIPRYDQLNLYDNGVLKYAEWHYGPQKRWLSSLKTEITRPSKIYDSMSIITAFQQIEESRITRKFKDDIRRIRREKVDVYSLNVDISKAISSKHALHYGWEGVYNYVQSDAERVNIITGESFHASTRYPDGGSIMQSSAVYLNHNFNYRKKIILNSGMRYNYILLHSDFDDTSFVPLPFNEIDIGNSAINASIGVTLMPSNTWTYKILAATGFRSPNVDDYGKVFVKKGKVIVPNNRLKPEYTYNAELQLEKTMMDHHIHISGNLFYTLLKDAIVRRNYTLNGQDSMMIEGEKNLIQANVNAGYAHLYGYALSVTANTGNHWSFSGNYNYTFGYNDAFGEPLAHIPPVFGKCSAEYSMKRIRSDLFIYFNGRKPIELYSSSGEDNADEATPDGTPAWFTLNLNNTVSFSDNFRIQLGIYNLLDHHYKSFASGISGAGRSLVFVLNINF